MENCEHISGIKIIFTNQLWFLISSRYCIHLQNAAFVKYLYILKMGVMKAKALF